MNTLITRLRTGSRTALSSALATVVLLPLGATIGLGTAAVAAPAVAPPPVAGLPAAPTDPGAAARRHDEFSILVFSKTAGFRHSNIDEGITAIQKLGVDNHFAVTSTEDGAAFTDENLALYDAVVFLSTTGDVLNATQQDAFERYIQAGGGYAGIHAASDTEYEWPWYGELVGSYFQGHPPGTPDATVKVEDPAHPSTAGITPLWERTDEWYNYRSNPRGDVHVLASLDESTYTGGTMGAEHPIAWCQDYDGGRSWYTGMGHTEASFTEPDFLKHVLGGIRTAAGDETADCAATLEPSFEKVALDDNTANPMELTIAEDGRVLYIDRNGAVRVIRTDGAVVTAGTVPVYTGQEFGLLGIALDPDFATNSWVYLYYSPEGATATDRVSRWTLDPATNTFVAGSKVDIIDIPTQRDQCCHAGGALEFDNDGDLYIATGDNSNPFDSDGYAPIDERAGRSAWDAQRSSANTNSLNGKVLRITPLDAGGYDVPTGNLFPAGTAQTRSEIYAMGFRNPFRIGLDEQNNKLLVADYGPDAGANSATRGPNGRVEWNILAEPGNYGWPYCVGDNTPYNDYNFATSTAGAAFDCSAPVNNSPNNTGLTNLPPAKAATMWQSNNGSITGVPEIGASGAPMTSGTYSYDADSTSPRKWPAYFDGKAIWADWNNSRLFTVQLNEAGTDYTDVNRFLPNLPMTRPHALQFGPDGALYMIEWGSGFGGNNADSGVYRIDYVQGNRAPVARASADRTSGPTPLTVQFDGSDSSDPDGTPLTYSWDFDGDGTADSTEATGSFTYTTVGDYTARLTVTDEDGRTAVSNIDIVAGNTAPTVELVLPAEGGFFEFGDTMRYKVVVTDPEDGTIDCDRVVVQPALGHDEHAHGYEQYTGCEGVLPLPGDDGHVGANIFGTITATYTDAGGAGGASALRGQDTIVVHTKRKEAEYFDTTGRLEGSTSNGDAGVTTETTGDTAGGGSNVSYAEAGDWFAFDMMNLTKIDTISLRVASPNTGTVWEVRTGSPTGPTVATINVPNTGGWQVYQDVSAPVTPSTVSGPLFFVETAGGSNVNWIDFGGDGITDNRRPILTATADVTSGQGPLTVTFDASATDPDDDAVSFEWSFGDGETGTGAQVSHTYETTGTYTAKVTATDARGAESSRTFEIKVLGAEETCFTGRSDGFDGTALDTDRWDAVVRPDGNATVSDGSLNIPLSDQDIYGSGGGPVPNIVLQHLPGGAFTVTTKVTLAAVRQYQQAGLVVYGDDDNYLKLVVQGRTASPDKAGNVIQFAKEVAGTATETNTNGLGADFPDTVWLRMSSPDGLAVTGSYSSDGVTYTDMTGARDLTAINEPRVGVMAFANNAAAANITAQFDYFQITPDNTAVPCGGGETCLEPFDGTSLADTWTVVRPTGNVTVGGGNLTVPMAGTDLYQTTNTAGDLVLRELPAGPFQVVTKVTAPIDRQYQQAGLIIYGDDDNYIKLVAQGRSASADVGSNIIQLTKETAAVATEANTAGLGATFPSTVWLRLTSLDGSAVTGDYSTDGQTWTAMPRGFDLAGMTDPRVGVTAFANNAAAATISAQFDSFELTADGCGPEVPDDTTAPTTTISLGEADGEAGWYRTRPTFTLTATDETDGSGVASTEYRIGGGEWTAYTEPVSVPGEGERLIEFRSTDAAGNVEEVGSETVNIDTVVPTVSAAQEGTETVTVTLTAEDATSGVAGIEYQLDDATSWTAYTTPIELTEPGTHVVRYRASDVAGNRSDVGTTTVVVDEPVEPGTPTVTVTTAPAAPGESGWFTGPVTVTLTGAGGEGELDLEYRIGFGAWTAYTEPFEVAKYGTTRVQARVTDEADTVSPVVTRLIQVDDVAPSIGVTGLTSGSRISVAALRSARVTTTDAASGIDKRSIRLDGRVVANPVRIDAAALRAGVHRLEVIVLDKAGNRSARTISFRVVATYPSGRALVARYDQENKVGAVLARTLRQELVNAQRADTAGQATQASQALVRFEQAARAVSDTPTRHALIYLARDLRAQI